MSLRTVAARAVSRGPLAEAGRRLALEVATQDSHRTAHRAAARRHAPRGRDARRTSGELHIHDPAAAWRMILNGEMGAGEGYMDGRTLEQP